MGTLRCETSDTQDLGGVSNVSILPEHSFHKSAGFLAGIVERREDSDQRLGQSDLKARRAQPAFRQRNRGAVGAGFVNLSGRRLGDFV